MGEIPTQQFPALSGLASLRHAFVLRQPGVPVDVDRGTALENLQPGFVAAALKLGIEPSRVATAEQVHGGEIAVVEHPEGLAAPVAGVDGLITRSPGLLLGICVADCCAVYVADRRGRAAALVHSGKKGTELGIAAKAVALMADFGVSVADLIVQLSPCIRPPAYEVDFASQIRADCEAAGVPAQQIFDDGTCTSRDLRRYYSYRVEKGETGRMLALMGIAAPLGG